MVITRVWESPSNEYTEEYILGEVIWTGNTPTSFWVVSEIRIKYGVLPSARERVEVIDQNGRLKIDFPYTAVALEHEYLH